MASKTTFSAAALLVLLVANTFLAGQVAACGSCKPPHHSPPKPSPPPKSPPPKSPPPPTPATPPSGTPGTPGTPCPPPPAPSPSPSTGTSCPTDALKLAACANVLGLVHVGLGHPPSGDSCCSILGGLADLEAAVCLCTALKANILGIVLNIPIKLTLLLNYCGKNAPDGFMCA